MTRTSWPPAIASALVVALLTVSTVPVSAQEAGTNTGAVTFTMTLEGTVDDLDAFLVIIACNDEWCDDETVDPILPDGKVVVFCGGPGSIDVPVCGPESFAFTKELENGSLEYWFYRLPGSAGDVSEWELLHNGTGEVLTGSQSVAMVYRYGGNTSLPDTALPAPS